MTLIRGNIRGHRAKRHSGASTGATILTDAWEQLRRDLRRGAPKKLRTDDRPRAAKPAITAGAAAVLGHLSDEPLRARNIAELTGFRTAQANTYVLQLSARGLATRTADGWVRS